MGRKDKDMHPNYYRGHYPGHYPQYQDPYAAYAAYGYPTPQPDPFNIRRAYIRPVEFGGGVAGYSPNGDAFGAIPATVELGPTTLDALDQTRRAMQQATDKVAAQVGSAVKIMALAGVGAALILALGRRK